MTLVIKILLCLAAAYIVIVAAAFAAQRRLTYFPDPTRVAPAQLGLNGVTEVGLPAPDGARLVAWYAPAPPGRPTLLYFHGNGGNLAGRALRFARYQNAELGVLMVSWRSYSGSTGTPSEAANVADARRAYEHLLAEGLTPSNIILYGESLGSGVAVRLAGEVAVAGLVLDAPFTSIVDIGAKAYPYLPVRWLMRDRYESDRHIAGVSAPLLILHGARDTVVPVAMGQRLYALAHEPKRLVVFPNGHHSDLDAHGAVDILRGWIDRLPQP